MDTLDMANDYVNTEWEEFEAKYKDIVDPDIMDYLYENRDHRNEWKGVPISRDGKVQLRDGRTGEDFNVLSVCDHAVLPLFFNFYFIPPPREEMGHLSFPSSRRRLAQPSRFFCRARATARASAGTSPVMVLPAAVKAPSPRVTGATRLVLQPMKAWSPMVVRYLFFPS